MLISLMLNLKFYFLITITNVLLNEVHPLQLNEVNPK